MRGVAPEGEGLQGDRLPRRGDPCELEGEPASRTKIRTTRTRHGEVPGRSGGRTTRLKQFPIRPSRNRSGQCEVRIRQDFFPYRAIHGTSSLCAFTRSPLGHLDQREVQPCPDTPGLPGRHGIRLHHLDRATAGGKKVDIVAVGFDRGHHSKPFVTREQFRRLVRKGIERSHRVAAGSEPSGEKQLHDWFLRLVPVVQGISAETRGTSEQKAVRSRWIERAGELKRERIRFQLQGDFRLELLDGGDHFARDELLRGLGGFVAGSQEEESGVREQADGMAEHGELSWLRCRVVSHHE